MRALNLALVALCLGTTSQAATLRTVTTLHAPVVRLSDLFDDAGESASRILGPGPGPGGRIVVEAAQLAAIAHQFKVDWRPSSPSDRAVLDWPGRPLRRDDVLAALRAALVDAGAATDCAIELAEFTAPLVPTEIDARPVVADLQYDAGAGRFGAVLSIAVAGMQPINLRIAGHVDDTVELPVSTVRLPTGAILRAEDVRLARVRASQLRGEMVQRLGDAIGMQAKHMIVAGQPFATGDLVRPALVQKGANLLMVLDSPGIALTAQGQALESGALGERIRVLNPQSRAVVEAEIIGPDRVRVAPTGVPLLPGDRATQVSVR